MSDERNTHPGDDLLVGFALHELDESERSPVERHMEECSSCRETVTALEASLDAYHRRPQNDAPANVLVALLEAQARNARSGSWRALFRPLRLAGAFSLVALLFAAGFFTGRHGAGSPPDRLSGETIAAAHGTAPTAAGGVRFQTAPSEAAFFAPSVSTPRQQAEVSAGGI